MKVDITAAAEADLEAIGDWIAEHNPARAWSFIRELRGECEALANAPEGYVLVPRYEHTGVRRKPYGSYLIFYCVMDDSIAVLHILHGARDYEPILFPEG
jgi:plasmid stabilization system protein ParE